MFLISIDPYVKEEAIWEHASLGSIWTAIPSMALKETGWRSTRKFWGLSVAWHYVALFYRPLTNGLNFRNGRLYGEHLCCLLSRILLPKYSVVSI
jgi:hypothetical protein